MEISIQSHTLISSLSQIDTHGIIRLKWIESTTDSQLWSIKDQLETSVLLGKYFEHTILILIYFSYFSISNIILINI